MDKADRIEAVARGLDIPKDHKSLFFKLNMDRYIELMLQVGRIEEGRPTKTWLDLLLEKKPEAVKEVIVMNGTFPKCPDLFFGNAPGAFGPDCIYVMENGSCRDCWNRAHGEKIHYRF